MPFLDLEIVWSFSFSSQNVLKIPDTTLNIAFGRDAKKCTHQAELPTKDIIITHYTTHNNAAALYECKCIQHTLCSCIRSQVKV